MRKTMLMILLTCVLGAGTAFAQFDGGLNFTVISPESGFKDNIDRLGYGLSGKFTAKLGNLPFYPGITIGGANYGSTTREEYLITPLFPVDVTTTNNLLFVDLLFQIRSEMRFIQPYVEGMVGFNYFWTETKIEELEDYEDDIASHTNFDDFAWNYGVGFGTLINLTTFDFDDPNSTKRGRLSLDFNVRYTFGGEAEYLDEDSIDIDDNDNVTYNAKHSETDFLSYHIGLVLHVF